ncbi:cell wall-binding repeat-containing protein [Catenulispora sp. NF23]|uniref:cell wall-binding repeat-containing protein n=1 Tax=Catenulispora pinistramenti TaxID=2705254 RepID=UPI001BAB62E7|nr:cell wall-binding repeat-containing protein [Catenulispora pinistramenti]MBS2535562.1 cell wall-binding repeat-containing protein [Catenulispora pinistramenti]
MAVGALAVLGAVPYTAVSAQAATSTASTAAPTASSPATTPEPATELIVEGQPGDMVTNGFTGVETGSAYALQSYANNDNAAWVPPVSNLSFQSIHNGDLNDPTSFGFAFNMPTGQQWAVGQTYTNTEGIVYGGGTQPWFFFSQFNTGPCGRPSSVIGAEDDKGTVKIDDLTWTNGVNSQIASMEVEFTQSCHGGPVTRGLFRYNETGPLPPGAPTGQPLPAGQGTVAPLTFRRGTSIISAPTGAVDGPRLATVSSAAEGATTWNPLGTRLLYSSDPGLSTVHPDGSGAAPLTEPPGVATKDTQPVETWDGSVVVFVQGDGGAVANLVSENTDGTTAGDAYRLPTGAACQQEHFPSFGADGSLIYECDSGGAQSVYHLGSSSAAQLIPNASQPASSNDGTKIAFVRPDGSGVPQVFTANADGSGITQVSHDPNGASKPAWSGDGKYLAYANEAFHEILEIPSAGGAPVGSIPDADDPDFTPPVVDSNVVRQAGADRIGTAIAASQLNFAGHGAADQLRAQAGAVVLARSDTFADALGGSALAVHANAPLLITGSAGLNPAVKTEIGRVLAPGGTVYLLGGPQALSPAVAAALSRYHVVRLAGDTRYGTAVAIAKQINPHPTTVMIATGAVFPDALAAGATGQPVLLTDGATMPKETLDYLKNLNPNPSAGGTELVTVGGPGDAALISAYKADKMPSWPAQIFRRKLAGADRYSTALLVAQTYFSSDLDAALATGSTWPDALSGGAMIGHRGGPLLLTAPTGISPAVLAYLRGQSASLYDLFLMGGPAALPNAIGQQAATVIGLPGHVRVGGAFAAPGEIASGAKDDASGAPKTGVKSAPKAGAGAKAGGAGQTAHAGDLSPVSREG